MPTILTLFGLRFVVYLNDHRPAHVHVLGNGCEAVFRLNCPSGEPELLKNHGFSLKDLRRIGSAIEGHHFELCERWRLINGHY
jgi:hypothetical protein